MFRFGILEHVHYCHNNFDNRNNNTNDMDDIYLMYTAAVR